VRNHSAEKLLLCEGGGLTKVRAGYTLENQYKSSSGHTPPLSQNRSLGAGDLHFLSSYFSVILSFLKYKFNIKIQTAKAEFHCDNLLSSRQEQDRHCLNLLFVLYFCFCHQFQNNTFHQYKNPFVHCR